MNWRPITKVVVIATAIFLAVYDFLPFADPARHDTISEVIAEWGLKLFTLPIVFGALCGHFFFVRDNCNRPNPYILGSTLIFLIILDIIVCVTDIHILEKLQTYPFIWFLLGIPYGAIFWPQTKSDKL